MKRNERWLQKRFKNKLIIHKFFFGESETYHSQKRKLRFRLGSNKIFTVNLTRITIFLTAIFKEIELLERLTSSGPISELDISTIWLKASWAWQASIREFKLRIDLVELSWLEDDL